MQFQTLLRFFSGILLMVTQLRRLAEEKAYLPLSRENKGKENHVWIVSTTIPHTINILEARRRMVSRLTY